MKRLVEVELPVDVEIEAEHHKAIRGSRDSFGVPLEPDEPEHWEIYSVQIRSQCARSGKVVKSDITDIVHTDPDLRMTIEEALEE